MGIAPGSRNAALGFACFALTAAASFGACTNAYRPAGSTGGAGPASASSTAVNSSSGGVGGFSFDSGPPCNDTCSNDLQSVVDCHGVVQATCTPDQGCANGKCIDDPCMAATLSKSSYGCDYFALKTAQPIQADGACFAVFVANTWGKPVHFLAVERDGQMLDPTKFAILASSIKQPFVYYDATAGLPVGEVALVFLSRKPQGSVIACPKGLAAIGAETGVPIDLGGDTGNGVGKAFHITTDVPVVAYQMSAYGGGTAGVTSATLLLPTSAWDTNYVAINAYKVAGSSSPGGNPSLDIVASVDGTQVTLLPSAAIAGNADGGVPAASPVNTPVTYTLDTGEFLQITQPAELTGSIISSTQPVGVFGASVCMEVPVNQPLCQPGEQQLPPVRALGSEYVAVRYRGRGADVDDGGVPDGGSNEAVPWRLVGAVNGTTLTWQPSQPMGAPTSLGLGQIAEFTTPGPFIVTSQDDAHPFYLGGYMTGGGLPPPNLSGFGGEGDPAWVNVITPAQFLNHYVLFTDTSFPETDLVLIRAPAAVDGGTAFADVTLSCAGASAPLTVAGWQPIGKYEWTRVDLSTGDFMGVNGCSNGRQELVSTAPFGVTVWGWGHASDQTQNVSYAYPAGAGFQPINMVMIPPIPN